MHDHHTHQKNLKGKKIVITILLNVLITAGELLGSFISGSLSLLTDAIHNFSDVMALFLTWISHKISLKGADFKGTYGYKRAEIFAALINSTTLVGIAIFIIYEAIKRIFSPQKLIPDIIIYLSLLSILLNFLSVIILKKESEKSINIRSSYLHLLTDLFTSLAVLFGGIAIYFFNFIWIDPIISILIAIYLIFESFKILKKSIFIFMQFSPEEVEIEEIEREMNNMEHIENIHHIHMWMLNEREIFFEAHVDFKENLTIKDANEIIDKIEKILKEKFNISHVTIQPEFERNDDKSLIVKR